MTDWLLKFYHHCPYPLKVMAATAQGLKLRWWRYGPKTEVLVEEALARETWERQAIKTWQAERLSMILHRAATTVPFYRELWAQKRRRGDRSSWEYLENSDCRFWRKSRYGKPPWPFWPRAVILAPCTWSILSAARASL